MNERPLDNINRLESIFEDKFAIVESEYKSWTMIFPKVLDFCVKYNAIKKKSSVVYSISKLEDMLPFLNKLEYSESYSINEPELIISYNENSKEAVIAEVLIPYKIYRPKSGNIRLSKSYKFRRCPDNKIGMIEYFHNQTVMMSSVSKSLIRTVGNNQKRLLKQMSSYSSPNDVVDEITKMFSLWNSKEKI